MRKTIMSAVFILVGVGSVSVGANLRGSDIMEDVVKFMLAGSPFCPGTTGLVFDGGGSTVGEYAMTGTGTVPLNVPLQSIAPMTRPLSNLVCSTKQGTPSSAAALVTCLDSVAIVGGGGAGPLCEIRYTPGNSNDWKDVLRLVYAGANPFPDFTRDCNSAARQALVNNWNNLFNAPCSGTTTCTSLQHAWRRNDYSGTTETFLALLGLPSSGSNPFCNGTGISLPITLATSTDFADNDPIRRPCHATGEQVCNNPLPGPNQNTLGVVQVAHVPETSAILLASQVYAPEACSVGQFAWKDHPAAVPLCPYGLPPTVGACLLPFQNTPTGPNFACTNSRTNRGFFLSATSPTGDGRVFNLIARKGTDASILRDINSRRLLGSFYRIHTSAVMPGGSGSGCKLGSSTDQINCLVAASPCSLGYVNQKPAAPPETVGLRLKGIAPTTATVQNIITEPTQAYPFARKVYVGSVVYPDIVGLGTAGTVAFRQQQQALVSCFADAAKAKTACEAGGLYEMPFGPTCDDFDEVATCGAATNVNACPSH